MQINFNPQIPSIPRLADKTLINIRYMLISPFANAHVYWDQKSGEVLYELEEPILSDEDRINLAKIEVSMQEMININFVVEKTPESLANYVDKTARLVISETGLNIEEDSYEKIFYYLYRNFVGLNEIEALMHDYFIEDIECNGVDEPLYIVHRVFRNMRTNVRFDTVEAS